MADQLRSTLPKLAALMDEAEVDVLAYMSFPAAHRAKLHSVNPLERLNGEIKRRTDVVGIFPNEGSIMRLLEAVLLEANDEWQLQHRYMQLEAMAERACFDAFDDGHGRLVRRRVFACTELEPLAVARHWPSLTTVLAIENIRSINGSGKVTAEIRYYLSSSKLPPTQLATAIRSHWTIENRLHWVLDVGFNEDASRIRERTAARSLALLRKIALNFARTNTTLNLASGRSLLRAASAPGDRQGVDGASPLR